MQDQKPLQYTLLGSLLLIVLIIGALTYLTVTFKNKSEQLTQNLATMTENRDTLQTTNASTSAALDKANATVQALASQLSLTSDQLSQLEDNYTAEKSKNTNFENQISELSGTVGALDKLSKTDKELLQKYSKVYFLNENYIPEALKNIPDKYIYSTNKTIEIHAKVLPYLENMLDDALDANVKIWIVSGYRSFGTQANLKNQYTQVYGSGANAFSADQGYSEHQLGTALDFTTEGINGGLDGFDNTAAYTWMKKNAYKYGFILSYPASNGYYEFEPWHWRFVGKDLAKYLHNNGLNFYDVDQRSIDTYLIKIFD